MDPFEQLAEIEVPPVPAAQTLRAGVRRKLNPRLLAMHVIEFALGATTWAVVHMAAALAAAVRYTVTGTWPNRRGHGGQADGQPTGLAPENQPPHGP